MSIFTSITDAIFGKNKAETPVRRPDPAATASTDNAWAAAPATGQRSVPVIDIPNHLDSMPGADRLNWRTSIVDLMKLIGVDSDYDSRKALAQEMGREDYSGTAEDNVWLHKRVMQELSSNGGRVPAELLD